MIKKPVFLIIDAFRTYDNKIKQVILKCLVNIFCGNNSTDPIQSMSIPWAFFIFEIKFCCLVLCV